MSYDISTYGEGFTVTTLNPCNRGRNKVGIAAHKPKKARTKRPKRQYPPGFAPTLHTMNGRREV